MCNIVSRIDQWSNSKESPTAASALYMDTLKQIKPSFYDVLWNDDFLVKQKLDNTAIHYKFIDGHPSPIESLEYLKLVTGIVFNDDTTQSVHNAQIKWQNYFRDLAPKSSQDIFRPCEMSKAQQEQISKDTKIWTQEKVKQL